MTVRDQEGPFPRSWRTGRGAFGSAVREESSGFGMVRSRLATADGLPSSNPGAIFADPEDRTWFAPPEGGLFLLKDAKVERVKVAGLDRDVVYSIAGDNDDVWVGRQSGRLTRLQYRAGTVQAKDYSPPNTAAQNVLCVVHRSTDGTVWAGTLNAGVRKLKDGVLTSLTTADGLASNTVTAIAEGSDGTMWFGTSNGLSAMSHHSWRTYGLSDGLHSNSINCMLAGSSGLLWIGTSEGLAFFRGGTVESPLNLPTALAEPVFGIASDRKGWLWIATSNHVLRVKSDSLLRGNFEDGDYREYGTWTVCSPWKERRGRSLSWRLPPAAFGSRWLVGFL